MQPGARLKRAVFESAVTVIRGDLD